MLVPTPWKPVKWDRFFSLYPDEKLEFFELKDAGTILKLTNKAGITIGYCSWDSWNIFKNGTLAFLRETVSDERRKKMETFLPHTYKNLLWKVPNIPLIAVAVFKNDEEANKFVPNIMFATWSLG